jgi:hypothetical protein
MTATLIPPASSMSPDPNNPSYRLWLLAHEYAHKKPNPDALSDRQFFEHIDAIARQPIGSPRHKRAIEQMYLFIRKLPYNADKRFRQGRFENPIRDEYENILDSVMARAIAQMWTEFNPTGKSFTGCFIHKWVNEKLRLQYLVLDFYRKINLDMPDEVSSTDSNAKLNLIDLNQLIASDQARIQAEKMQARLKQQQVKVLDAFAEDVERSPFWVTNHLMNEPRCNYRMLAKRLLFGTDKIQEIVDEFQAEGQRFEYQAFYAQYKRDFISAVLLRRLENNLFAPSLIEMIKEAIAINPTLDKPVYTKYPAIAPKFMAKQLLPMFRPQPLTLQEIIKLLQSSEYDYLTYKNLKEPELESIWRNKCYPRIGKEVEKVLHYSKGSDI